MQRSNFVLRPRHLTGINSRRLGRERLFQFGFKQNLIGLELPNLAAQRVDLIVGFRRRRALGRDCRRRGRPGRRGRLICWRRGRRFVRKCGDFGRDISQPEVDDFDIPFRVYALELLQRGLGFHIPGQRLRGLAVALHLIGLLDRVVDPDVMIVNSIRARGNQARHKRQEEQDRKPFHRN